MCLNGNVLLLKPKRQLFSGYFFIISFLVVFF